MSLFGIDSQNLVVQNYIPFADSAPAINSPANRNAGGQDQFAQMLERAVEGQASAAENSARQTQSAGTTSISENKKAYIDKNSKLFETCQEFETFLIKNLIKSMRGTIQKTDLIDTGFAGQIYEDMLYDEYAKDYAKNAGFGFAELAYLELSGQRGKTITRY